MTKFGKTISGLVIILILGITLFLLQKEPNLVDPIVDNNEQNNSISEISGNKDDLVSFSVTPGQKVSGILEFSGSVRNAYFFEGNIQIGILDKDKNLLKGSYATATTDWMTVEPVEFMGTIDLNGLPSGPAFLEIHNDNASGLPENDKSILVPIIIEVSKIIKSNSQVIADIKSKDQGPLKECTLNNQTYFFAKGSAFDGSDNIYDNKGNLVAKCGGGWGMRPDPYPEICAEMYEEAECSYI